MLDLMIDLETMGTTPDSAIVALGIVEFDSKTGELGNSLYRVIDLSTSVPYGFKIQPSTLYWWLEQSEEARLALIQDSNRESVEEAMLSVTRFVNSGNNAARKRLWGNGPTFDNAMIRYTYEVVMGHQFPIPFWNDRCVRTIKGFYPYNLWRQWQIDNPRRGTFHNALDDAKYQVKYLCHILQELDAGDLY